MFIVEEKILGQYTLDPLMVVGYEGLWGLLMWVVLLPIFQNIHCDNLKLCPYGRLEDTLRAFKDYAANPILILLSISICFTIALFNSFGVAVTKHASAAQRATIDTSRTLLIWIFFLIVAVHGQKETFYPLQLVGFMFLVAGTLVFNEIVVIRFFGFDQNTKKALALKKSENDNT
jgi:hypothetical protein